MAGDSIMAEPGIMSWGGGGSVLMVQRIAAELKLLAGLEIPSCGSELMKT